MAIASTDCFDNQNVGRESIIKFAGLFRITSFTDDLDSLYGSD
jgi:hypothetical protein